MAPVSRTLTWMGEGSSEMEKMGVDFCGSLMVPSSCAAVALVMVDLVVGSEAWVSHGSGMDPNSLEQKRE